MGASRDGELVGTAGFSIQQGEPNAHKGRLFGMYVRSSLRNLGLGRLLLNAVLDVARESVELVQLSVVSENRPALRLYESVGFLEFGREAKASKYGDKYYDETLMVLDSNSLARLSGWASMLYRVSLERVPSRVLQSSNPQRKLRHDPLPTIGSAHEETRYRPDRHVVDTLEPPHAIKPR
jgi:hypothetical protein